MGAQRGTIPPLAGEVVVAGLDGPVTIHRDAFGIPHIDASSVADMFFAQGFACAQDRLWQMDYDRRRGLGTVAEILGSAGLRNDRFARRARLAQYSREGFDALDDETKAMLASYSAGVNRFLQSTDARPVEIVELGYEPEAWEPWHCVAAFVARHIVFGTWLTKLFRGRVLRAFGHDAAMAMRREGRPGDEVTVILPPGATAPIPPTGDLDTAPAEEAVALLGRAFGAADPQPPLEPAAVAAGERDDSDASNSWVVDGTRTASGKPLLCGDSHRGQEIPNVYYQVHLRAPGIDCAGFAFAGVPGVPHFGHSGGAAWCVTNASAEYQDLFVERFAPGGTYEHRGAQVAADVRTERIDVRGEAADEVECWATVHGPVVVGNPRDGAAIALASSGLVEAGGSLRCCLPLMRARTVDDVLDTLGDWVEPANNYLVADADGEVVYATAAKIPNRPALNAWLPVPGWTGEFDWQGFAPFGDLPRARNPQGGIVPTANNRIAAEQPVLLGVDYAPSGRAARLHVRLGEIQDGTTRHMAQVHADAVTRSAPAFVARVCAVAAEGDAKLAQDLLASWDGVMDADSAGAALYEQVKGELATLVAASGHLDPIRNALPDEPPAGVVSLTTRLSRSMKLLQDDAGSFVLRGTGESWDRLIARALGDAWTALVARLGPDPDAWRWGALHVHTPIHPLRAVRPDLVSSLQPPALELSGNSECVLATLSQPAITHACVGGPVARYVFDLSNRDAGGWCSPLGASGHPDSAHFADQQSLWARCELVPMVTSWDAVESSARTTQRLVPLS